jgi:DNA-binding transcriptional MerR regulator
MMWSMDADTRYSLADLARVTGVTPRTVRYYIVQGLLPGANESGPGASYDERHLRRLRLIRELQRQHLPLAEIRARLAELSDNEVAELLEAQTVKAEEPAGSALEYVRSVLGSAGQKPPQSLMRMAASAPAGATSATSAPRLMREFASEPGTLFSEAAPASPSEPSKESAPTAERSQWDRIALTNDIELHVRRPLSRLDNRRVERLITIARQVLGEEKP